MSEPYKHLARLPKQQHSQLSPSLLPGLKPNSRRKELPFFHNPQGTFQGSPILYKEWVMNTRNSLQISIQWKSRGCMRGSQFYPSTLSKLQVILNSDPQTTEYIHKNKCSRVKHPFNKLFLSTIYIQYSNC